jgi:hypothetical protein
MMRSTGLSRNKLEMETLSSLPRYGRPRKIWLIELGYSSDIRYMDKVIEKR